MPKSERRSITRKKKTKKNRIKIIKLINVNEVKYKKSTSPKMIKEITFLWQTKIKKNIYITICLGFTRTVRGVRAYVRIYELI